MSEGGVESDHRVELVDIVDENDVVVDVVSRTVMRRKRLRHRSVFIVVTSSSGDVLVHRRSETKDIWPGWVDIAVGGVLQSGETYEQGAKREIAEELGIDSIEISTFDDGLARPYHDEDVSLLGRCFIVSHDGPFTFRDGEVADAWWMSVDELSDLVRDHRVLPDSCALLLDRLLELGDD